MNKYLIGIIIALLIFSSFAVKSCKDEKAEKIVYKSNQTGLLEGVKYYRNKDSLSIADVQVLTLKKKDLEGNRVDLLKTIDGLNIKLKRVQSASTTETETKYKIKTVVKDSLVYRDGKTITLKCIDYSDKWMTVKGCDQDGTFTGNVESRDKIDQVVYGVPHRFWFIKWGVKSIRQTVISQNPNSTITFQEYIELTK